MFGLLPPSSSVSFFRLRGPGRRDDELADLGGAGERDLVDVAVGGQRRAGGLAEPRYDVDDTGGHAGLGDELGQPQRRQRRLLGGLENDGAAGGERGTELPGRHQQREVPRDDLADDPDGLAQRVGVEVRARHVGHRDVDGLAVDLGGPAGHVVEQVGGERHVRAERDGIGLAVVERLELREFLRVLEDQVPDPPDDAAAVGWRHPAPRAVLERGTGRADRAVDVLGVALGDARQSLAGRGVRGLERLARRRIGPLAVDEQLTGGRDEGLDALIQGDGHRGLISLPADGRGFDAGAGRR